MGRTIFEEASVLDGDLPAQVGLTVVVEDGMIATVGQKISPRPGDRVLQLGGRTASLRAIFTRLTETPIHFHLRWERSTRQHFSRCWRQKMLAPL
jgi:hypothetical protein